MPSSDIEILFVSHKYPPSIGGMEKQSYELINGAALYAKVHTLVYTGKESILTFFLLLQKRIRRKLKNNPQIHIIHFNDGLIASLALFHRAYPHIKKVVTVHGLDIVFPLSYFQQKILPRFNRFDKIVAVSQATAEAAVHRGIQEDKIMVIENGVDQQIADEPLITVDTIHKTYPRIDNQKKYFITLGRPIKRKGFSWLIENVISHLEKDIQLVMVGPFQEKSTWKEKLLQALPNHIYKLATLFMGYPTDQHAIRQLLRQYPQVVHLGKVPFSDLKTLLANSSAFLMPNIPVDGDMEGFGLVCLEASLANTLVVASSLEGITTAIHDKKNGLLLPALDEEAWIRQLKSILENPDLFKRKSTLFKTYTLDNFSWDKMSRAYVQLFQYLAKT